MLISQLTLWHTLVAHADPVQVVHLAHLCGPTHIQEYAHKLEPDYATHDVWLQLLTPTMTILWRLDFLSSLTTRVCSLYFEALFLAIEVPSSSLKPCLASVQQIPFNSLTLFRHIQMGHQWIIQKPL